MTLPELDLVYTSSLQPLLGRNFGVEICALLAAAGSIWEVTAIDPLSSCSALTAALQAIADLRQCFTLDAHP